MSVDLSDGVATTTLLADLSAMAEHIVATRGALRIQPLGGGMWSGSVQHSTGDALSYEATMGDSVGDVLAQLRGRIGA